MLQSSSPSSATTRIPEFTATFNDEDQSAEMAKTIFSGEEKNNNKTRITSDYKVQSSMKNGALQNSLATAFYEMED